MTNEPTFIVVDLFCGAGGTSIGFAKSGVAKVIAAVNHDPKAIKSHWANHPEVHHFEEDIRTLDLTELSNVVRFQQNIHPNAHLLLHASLECTNFSKAKGGMPRDADSRTLAEHLPRYVEAINPDYITIENVVEFMAWGPLDENGKPVSKKNGQDWLRWRKSMCSYSYYDDWREINSADLGARTSRNRLFGIFARHHLPISWPELTHAKNPEKAGMFAGLKKWQPCRPCLDLDDKGESIFKAGKIRSDKTFERIYAGLIKFVAGMSQKEFLLKYNSMASSGDMQHSVNSVESPAPTIPAQRQPNIVSIDYMLSYHHGDALRKTDDPAGTITASDKMGVVQIISAYYGSGDNNTSVDEAAPTLVTGDRHSLVSAEWLDRQFSSGSKYQGIDMPAGSLTTVPKMNLVQPEFIMDTQFGNSCKSTENPLPTITANRKWFYLMNPQYMNAGSDLNKPCFTLIARMDKMPPYLVEVDGGAVAIEVYNTDSAIVRKIKHFMALYGIMDIKMRMLKVIELKRIQGFPEDYKLFGNQADQKKFIGNSVQPDVPMFWMRALHNKLSNSRIKTA